MKLIYTPEGQEPQEWRLKDPSDLHGLEPEYIEEAGGTQWDTWAEWGNLLSRGGFRAIRVFLWVLLRRENPGLELNSVQPSLSEIKFDFEDDDEVEPGKDGTEAPTPLGDGSTASVSPNAA